MTTNSTMEPTEMKDPHIASSDLDNASSLFNKDENDTDTFDDLLLSTDGTSIDSLNLFEGIDDFLYSKLQSSPLFVDEVEYPQSIQSTGSEVDFTSDFLDLEGFINNSFTVNSPEPALTESEKHVADKFVPELLALDMQTSSAQECVLPYEDADALGLHHLQEETNTQFPSSCIESGTLETVEVLSSGTGNASDVPSSSLGTISLEDVISISGLDVHLSAPGCVEEATGTTTTSTTLKRDIPLADSSSDDGPSSPKKTCVPASPDTNVGDHKKKVDERRRKNNIASRVSRASRKSRHKALFETEARLDKENSALRVQIEDMTKEAELLRKLLIEKLSKVNN